MLTDGSAAKVDGEKRVKMRRESKGRSSRQAIFGAILAECRLKRWARFDPRLLLLIVVSIQRGGWTMETKQFNELNAKGECSQVEVVKTVTAVQLR